MALVIKKLGAENIFPQSFFHRQCHEILTLIFSSINFLIILLVYNVRFKNLFKTRSITYLNIKGDSLQYSLALSKSFVVGAVKSQI
jgi:hypothetical protein